MASMPAVTARLGPKTLKFQTIVCDSAGAENRAPANTLATNAYGPCLMVDPPCGAPFVGTWKAVWPNSHRGSTSETRADGRASPRRQAFTPSAANYRKRREFNDRRRERADREEYPSSPMVGHRTG